MPMPMRQGRDLLLCSMGAGLPSAIDGSTAQQQRPGATAPASPPLLFVLLLLLLAPSFVHARYCCYADSNSKDCCYADSNKARVLPFPGRAPPHQASLTRESCMRYCADAGFVLAGVEAGSQCFCGNRTAAAAQRADPESCGKLCSGNSSETCGANYFVDLMTLSCGGPPDPPPPPPPPPPPSPRPPYAKGLKNVLFIGSDDMRAELGTYGSAHMHTPNLDRLGASGTVFERAYIAVSVCMPSRTALLTSRRPDSTRNYELRGAAEYHRNVVNATTIPQLFKESGYVTYGCGKLFHCTCWLPCPRCLRRDSFSTLTRFTAPCGCFSPRIPHAACR
jgi:hypothetical protein